MMVVMTSFIPVIPVMCHPAVSCMPVQARSPLLSSPTQIDHIDEAVIPSGKHIEPHLNINTRQLHQLD